MNQGKFIIILKDIRDKIGRSNNILVHNRNNNILSNNNNNNNSNNNAAVSLKGDITKNSESAIDWRNGGRGG